MNDVEKIYKLENLFRIQYLKSLCSEENLVKCSLVEKQIENNQEPAVIIINGFLNENEEDISEWEHSLKRLWRNGSWYYLDWESQSKLDFIWTKLNGNPSKMSAWKNALVNTQITGELLAKTIVRSNNILILCGHSLGARVIYHALKYLDKHNKESMKKIKEVNLLGGAVGCKYNNWKFVEEYENLKINNYYSMNDDVLKLAYEFGTLDGKAIGINKIDIDSIVNIDTSTRVDGHSDYKRHLALFYLKEFSIKKQKINIEIKI